MPRTQEKLGNRRTTGKEQFYTPQSTAHEILERVLTHSQRLGTAKFLEPAGGTGAFVNAAIDAGFDEIISMDIEPRHPRVNFGNFLTDQLDLEGAIAVTNPPFGRNNSLSVPFFNKAAQNCDLIAFIVPRSWRKWTVLNRLDPAFELIDDWDLQIDYVDEKGEFTHGAGNLRTCVQIWRRLSSGTRLPVTVKDNGFIERVKPEDADVSFTLFGYGCGTTRTEFDRKPNSTQTYFRLLRDDALEALSSSDFSRFYSHTAYTEALSTAEINYTLNEWSGLLDFEYSLVPGQPNYLGLQYAKQGLF